MKAVHLLTNPNDHREARSIIEIRQIMGLAGFQYIECVNPEYEGKYLPIPRDEPNRPFHLMPAHYGCYLAHKAAISQYLDEEGLLVFECDAVFTVDYDEAVKRLKRAVEVCQKHPEIILFQFGYRHDGQVISQPEPDILTINQFIETHAYYVPWSSRYFFESAFSEPWDALDYVYTVYLCDQRGAQVAIFNDRPICVQGIGVSLIDGKVKGSEPHYRSVRYETGKT